MKIDESKSQKARQPRHSYVAGRRAALAVYTTVRTGPRQRPTAMTDGYSSSASSQDTTYSLFLRFLPCSARFCATAGRALSLFPLCWQAGKRWFALPCPAMPWTWVSRGREPLSPPPSNPNKLCVNSQPSQAAYPNLVLEAGHTPGSFVLCSCSARAIGPKLVPHHRYTKTHRLFHPPWPGRITNPTLRCPIVVMIAPGIFFFVSGLLS